MPREVQLVRDGSASPIGESLSRIAERAREDREAAAARYDAIFPRIDAAQLRRNRLDATRAPLPSDDETQGYEVGSRWMCQGQEWVLTAEGWVPVSSGDFPDRASALAATTTQAQIRVSGLDYQYDLTGTALINAAGTRYSPRGAVTALHWGAYNAASYNASAAWLRATGGGTIQTPDTAGQIAITSPVNIEGVTLQGGKFLIQTGSGHAFFASGTVTSLTTLAAPAARGDKQITLASAAGIAAGTILCLSGNAAYATTDAAYRDGEMLEVLSVSGAVVTLKTPVLGAYDRAAYPVGARIAIVALAAQTRMLGVSIDGTPTGTGIAIYLSYVRDPVISLVRTRDHGNTAIRLHGCWGATVEFCEASDLTMNLATGQPGYAVALSGPDMRSKIRNCKSTRVRHAFTTMGGDLGFPRQFVVSDCEDFESKSGAFDTHAAGSDWEMRNCVAHDSAGSAYQIRAPFGILRNCTAFRAAVHGINIAENIAQGLTIIGSVLHDIAQVGIVSSVPVPNLKIINNDLRRIGNRAIRLFNGATTPSPGLEVVGNTVSDAAIVAAVEAVAIEGAVSTGALLRNNTVIRGSGQATYGIRAIGITSGDVVDNLAVGAFTTAPYSFLSGVTQRNNAVGGVA